MSPMEYLACVILIFDLVITLSLKRPVRYLIHNVVCDRPGEREVLARARGGRYPTRSSGIKADNAGAQGVSVGPDRKLSTAKQRNSKASEQIKRL